MKLLILGGDGMLGHQLLKYFSRSHDVKVTLRQGEHAYKEHQLFSNANGWFEVDVRNFEQVSAIIREAQPDVIINAVGVIKQRDDAADRTISLEVNSLLPHRLVKTGREVGARVVHFSTDCVFSGSRGMYREDDFSDANDIYGRTKYLGEVAGRGALTLRTSIIGHELQRKTSLVEWFMRQRGSIHGYKNAIFSGLTTIEVSRVVERVLSGKKEISGVWHVSSDPISKFDLLTLIKREYQMDIEIIPDEEVKCDRSLDSSRFRNEVGYRPPDWKTMIAEMRNEMGADR